jgi:hypothetical protein
MKVPQEAEQLRFDPRKSDPRHGRPRMNYDVPSRGDLRTLPPKDFSDAPADSIADHRASQRFLDADAETASRPAISAIKNHELRRGFPAAAAIDGLEFGAAYQTRGARKTLRRTLRIVKWA